MKSKVSLNFGLLLKVKSFTNKIILISIPSYYLHYMNIPNEDTGMAFCLLQSKDMSFQKTILNFWQIFKHFSQGSHGNPLFELASFLHEVQ